MATITTVTEPLGRRALRHVMKNVLGYDDDDITILYKLFIKSTGQLRRYGQSSSKLKDLSTILGNTALFNELKLIIFYMIIYNANDEVVLRLTEEEYNKIDFNDLEERFYSYKQKKFAGSLTVHNSGIPSINGNYSFSDIHDGVGKFTKKSLWEGKEVTFSLFRSKDDKNVRWWYISIVPDNSIPGTDEDVDFYFAPSLNIDIEHPPKKWLTCPQNGEDPAPSCTCRTDSQYDNEYKELLQAMDVSFLKN